MLAQNPEGTEKADVNVKHVMSSKVIQLCAEVLVDYIRKKSLDS